MSIINPTGEHKPDITRAEQTAVTPARSYGPWSPTVDATERVAQLRSLSALAFAYFGPDHRLISELRAGETDIGGFARDQDLVEALPALIHRRILSTFARVTWSWRVR